MSDFSELLVKVTAKNKGAFIGFDGKLLCIYIYYGDVSINIVQPKLSGRFAFKTKVTSTSATCSIQPVHTKININKVFFTQFSSRCSFLSSECGPKHSLVANMFICHSWIVQLFLMLALWHKWHLAPQLCSYVAM